MRQVKPMWVGHSKGKLTYGIRNQGSISVLLNRPWYRGDFYIDGRNTHYLWDKEGRYAKSIRGWRRVASRRGLK